jgi:6-phosphogluconate dehydrogenase
MDLGMIGLGRMGGNMARRLLRGGHRIVGYNRSPQATQELAVEAGLTPAYSLDEVLGLLPKPRHIWVMVPAGEATESTLLELSQHLETGETLIDGGNSNYKDSIRRAALLKEKGLNFVDVGTSGGIWGLKEGYSLMIGGEKEPVERLRPIFETLAPAPDQGWGHVGPHGAGHFVKMVHNGIEYGLMQAYAEGFEILRAKQEMHLDLHQVAELWRWTVFEAVDLDVPAPVITLALQARFISRQDESYAAKLLAAMRNQFGGHAVKPA